MKRALRLVILVPFLLLLVLFELSNRQSVELTLWPTDLQWTTALSIAVLAALALGALIGGLLVWLSVLSHRARARRAEKQARLLAGQLKETRERADISASTPRLAGPNG